MHDVPALLYTKNSRHYLVIAYGSINSILGGIFNASKTWKAPIPARKIVQTWFRKFMIVEVCLMKRTGVRRKQLDDRFQYLPLPKVRYALNKHKNRMKKWSSGWVFRYVKWGFRDLSALSTYVLDLNLRMSDLEHSTTLYSHHMSIIVFVSFFGATFCPNSYYIGCFNLVYSRAIFRSKNHQSLCRTLSNDDFFCLAWFVLDIFLAGLLTFFLECDHTN